RVEQIVDILNANPIKYALTVNPTIFESCVEQFWSTRVVKKVNGDVQIHALIDGKRIVVSKPTIRRDLQFADEGGVDCLPTAIIFEEIARMWYEKPSQKLTFYKAFFSPKWKFMIHTILNANSKTTTWNEFSSTVALAIICLATNHKFNFSKFILEGVASIRETYIVPTTLRNFLGNIEEPDMVVDEDVIIERVTKQSNDPLSGEDRLKLQELMEVCANLQRRVFILEETKTTQAAEIISLKKKVKKLQKGKKSRTHKLKRLYKVGLSAKVVSSKDEVVLDDLARDEVVIESKAASMDVNLNEDEVTLAQTLQKIKSTTPRAKGVVIREREQEARRLQAHFDEEARITNEEALRIEEADLALTKEWNNIQDKIDADYELAQRLQAEEHEELTDAEKAKLFVQLLEARKKHFAARRVEEQRSKPLTKA
ncbi:hypothetical protein Tco_1434525, partial [Tanacetum coccineum]